MPGAANVIHDAQVASGAVDHYTPSFHRAFHVSFLSSTYRVSLEKKNAAAVENFAFTDAIPTVIPTVLTGPYPKGGQDGQAMTVSQGPLSPNL